MMIPAVAAAEPPTTITIVEQEEQPGEDYSCRKGEPKTTTTHDDTPIIFCVHNSAIEQKLVKMHELQRAGNKCVQREIDQYLIMCLDERFKELTLPRSCVPHYDNLPDMFRYALGILDPRMDCVDGLQQILLLLRQCLPLRRRTKRAQREVQWKMESMFSMQTLIRCTQGLLLGLYPTSLFNIAFKARMGVYVFLRTVLVQPFHVLQRVMQKISYILKLGVMEHLCNITWDYYPSICHTLNQSGQMVEHFCNSVSTICDIFRSELNTLFCTALEKQNSSCGGNNFLLPARVFMSILPSLEKIAHSYFERCTRAYRGIIIGNAIQARPVDIAKRLLHSAEIIENIQYITENIHVAQSKNMFDMTHFHLFREKPVLLQFAWLLTEIIRVKPLPSCVIEKQLNALSRRYSGDTYCMEQCKVLHVCIFCVIRKGGACGMRLRHDCQSDEIQCIHCGSKPVLSIDMLGRVVTIGNDIVILSSCCGQYIHYGGTGHEFSAVCGVQCLPFRQLFRKKQRSAGVPQAQEQPQYSNKRSSASFAREGESKKGAYRPKNINNKPQDPSASDFMNGAASISFKFHGLKKTNRQQQQTYLTAAHAANLPTAHQQQGSSNKKHSLCEICRQKNIYQTLYVLDVQKRAMIGCCLCSKHTIPQHVCCSILEISDIHRYIRCFKTAGHATEEETWGDKASSKGMRGRNASSSAASSGGHLIQPNFKKKRGRKKKQVILFSSAASSS